jgi:hypothetical protein
MLDDRPPSEEANNYIWLERRERAKEKQGQRVHVRANLLVHSAVSWVMKPGGLNAKVGFLRIGCWRGTARAYLTAARLTSPFK